MPFLAFFATGIGKYVLGILIAGLVIGGVVKGLERRGYNKAWAQCEAAAEKRKKEIADRDIRIGQLSAEKDKIEQATQKKLTDKDSEHERKLEEALSKIKIPAGQKPRSGTCQLDDAGVRWLR